MKRFRVILVTALVVLMTGAIGLAQQRGERRRAGRQGAAARRMRQGVGQGQMLRVLGELDLTDEQKEKVAKLREDFTKRAEENRAEMREAFQELRKFRQENPNDQEGLRKKREEMRGKIAPMREATQNLLEEVKGVLNEDQIKKLEEIQQRGMRRRGIRTGPVLPGVPPQVIGQLELTDEQQEKVKGLAQAYQEEQRQLIEKYKGLLKLFLTPEQAEKFEKAMAAIPQAGVRGQRGGRGGAAGGRAPRRGGGAGGPRPGRPGRPPVPEEVEAPAE